MLQPFLSKGDQSALLPDVWRDRAAKEWEAVGLCGTSPRTSGYLYLGGPFLLPLPEPETLICVTHLAPNHKGCFLRIGLTVTPVG